MCNHCLPVRVCILTAHSSSVATVTTLSLTADHARSHARCARTLVSTVVVAVAVCGSIVLCKVHRVVVKLEKSPITQTYKQLE